MLLFCFVVKCQRMRLWPYFWVAFVLMCQWSCVCQCIDKIGTSKQCLYSTHVHITKTKRSSKTFQFTVDNIRVLFTIDINRKTGSMTQYHSLTFNLFLLQGNVYARHNAVTTERSSLTLLTASYGILSCLILS